MEIRKVTLLSDMDGTLLSSNGKVSERNKEAIRRFIEAGGHFGIATGRGHINVLSFIEGVEINAPSILYNGSMLYDFTEKEVLRSENLPVEKLTEAIKWIQVTYPEIMIHIYTPDTCHLVSKEENADAKILSDHQPAVFSELKEAMAEPWIKVLLAGENTALREIEKRLESELHGDMRWVYSADIYLELLPLGVSKASMLKKLKEIHGEDHRIIAAGDFYNDLEMIKAADYGIAMGNAPDEIKEAADGIAVSNDEDGIAWIIEAILSGELEERARK
ncbi:Cof-type HAD-IIB family hydrolase [Proteiniclasticum sp. C24MP]|uniref:Cof-type HAD-IIB family hydrolase n=1 Tax=Proteiniclasticum sp. C24MP TaxID=3374101 RepID=UPI0037552380